MIHSEMSAARSDLRVKRLKMCAQNRAEASPAQTIAMLINTLQISMNADIMPL